MSKTKDFNNEANKIDNQGITTRSTGGNEQTEELMETEKSITTQKNDEINFFGLFKILYDVDLLSGYIYVITFALFPSVSISQRLFDFHKYRAITIITIYNVFDTIGRSVVSKIKPNKILSYIVICGRSILLFTLIFNDYCQVKLEWNNNITNGQIIPELYKR